MKFSTKTAPRPIYLAALALVLLLAFGLRAYRLEAQSLWSDEGASAVMATRSLIQIIENSAADIHPPLYYFLLRGWAPLAETGEFALRFPSVLLGVLLVALVFKLAARLFGSSVGLIGAFIAATSPLLIYYSQEARMYMPMAFLATLSTYIFLLLTGILSERKVERVWLIWASYIVATAAMLYTQYFSFTIVLFQNFIFLITFWRIDRQGRRWLAWGLSQATVALLFLPWFLKVTAQVGTWQTSAPPMELGEMLWRVFQVFSLGPAWDAATSTQASLLFGGILLASLLWVALGDGEGELFSRLRSLSLMAFYILLPILAMYLVSLQRPMFHHKFLLVCAPAYYILLALGVASLGALVERTTRLLMNPFGNPTCHSERSEESCYAQDRLREESGDPSLTPSALRLRPDGLKPEGASARRLRVTDKRLLFTRVPHLFQTAGALGSVLLLISLSFASSPSLLAYYFEPKYARDDYRGLARYIESHPGDAILVNAPGQLEILNYYYRGDLPRYPLPRQRPMDAVATERELAGIAARHKNIWLVLWGVTESDPNRLIESWLNNHTYRMFSRWFGGIQLVGYSGSTSALAASQALNVNFAEGIRLTSYWIEGDKPLSSGEVLRLALQWEAKSSPNKRYKVFTHILDKQSYLWGQHDSEPQGGAKPTTDWRPSEVVQDRHGLAIYPGTPPGEYQIEVGLYEAESGKRLPVVEGGKEVADRVLLGPVQILKPAQPVTPAMLTHHRVADVAFSKLKLLGYTLSKVGSEGAKSNFAKGDIALLALYWQALEKPAIDYKLKLELRDEKGRVVLSREGQPTEGNYPTSLWEKGEITLDQHKVPLSILPGQYDLFLGVTEGDRPTNPSEGRAPIAGGFVKLEHITIQ